MFQMCCRRMHALPAFGVIPCARGTQIASESLSPVRIRRTVSTGTTKILPSPMRPVFAAADIASTTRSARDRKDGVEGKGGVVRVVLGGRRIHKKTNKIHE